MARVRGLLSPSSLKVFNVSHYLFHFVSSLDWLISIYYRKYKKRSHKTLRHRAFFGSLEARPLTILYVIFYFETHPSIFYYIFAVLSTFGKFNFPRP